MSAAVVGAAAIVMASYAVIVWVIVRIEREHRAEQRYRELHPWEDDR